MRSYIFVAAVTLAAAGTALAETRFGAPVIDAPGAIISAAFGPRADSDRYHIGADIAAEAGAPVHAPADGRVLRVHAPGELTGYHGQVVVIDHGALGRTRFSNLEAVALAPGAEVRAGDVIGRIIAAERPHVHVELWRGDAVLDPAVEMTLIAAR
jgi:murein DD-endopeptidase MepM/ murein hydrolase activator NlpD